MITLPYPTEGDPQEVYDFVVNHLRTQGCRAMTVIDGRLQCAYRGKNGTKCAVGALIPDDVYDPEWEGANVRHLVLSVYVGGPVFKRNMDLLSALQWRVHDPEHHWDTDGLNAYGEQGLRDVAADFGLVYTLPPEKEAP